MAYISKQCVYCTDPTKKSCGEYRGKDEKGRYKGTLYQCENTGCTVNYERRRARKELPAFDDKK